MVVIIVGSDNDVMASEFFFSTPKDDEVVKSLSMGAMMIFSQSSNIARTIHE